MAGTIRVKPLWLVITFCVVAITSDPLKVLGCLLAIVASLSLPNPQAFWCDLQLAFWAFLEMDSKASALLAALKSGHMSSNSALVQLNELKGDIKHRQVPQLAVIPLFRLVDYAVSSLHYADIGFSILGHLVKRLILQEQKELLVAQGLKIIPSVINSLGDQKDRIRQRANQALSEFWHLSPVDVEHIIRDTALTSEISKVKEAGMRWILKTKKEHEMQFKSFIPSIIDCLKDIDKSVRETAKNTIVGLFKSITNDRAKLDLQKRLQQPEIDQSTIVYILTQLGIAVPRELEPANPPVASAAKPPTVPQITSRNTSRTRPQPIPQSTSRNTSLTRPRAVSNTTSQRISDVQPSAAKSKPTQAPSTKNPQTTSTTHTRETKAFKKPEAITKSTTSDEPPAVATTSVAEREADQLEPVYVDTARDIEDIFREMQPHFEGKESEKNWSPREKSVIKLRRINKGNAPAELTTVYLAGIKGLLDGILKTVNSLRTTVCSNGCHLIQDLARVAGSGLDNMVEILLQNLIKLCANTKKISASNGNTTVDVILANVSYNIRLLQHIWNAVQDKNVQPRIFAAGWLKTIMSKHGQRKNTLEHGGGTDLIEKCIKAGLADRDKKVRDDMRPTYWAFARICPEKSEHILSSLETKQQELLIEDSSNPNPQPIAAVVLDTSLASSSAPALSRSTTSVPAARPSIRETIAAQKRAKLASSRALERPGSADSAILSPKTKPSFSTSTSRPATAVGSLSSAPVRPFRMAKKPDVAKQAPVARSTAATDVPTGRSPSSQSPSDSNLPSEPPAVEVPVVEASFVEVPAVEAPLVGVPAVEAPSIEVPTVEPSPKGDRVDKNPSRNLSGIESGPEKSLQVYEDPTTQPDEPPTQHLSQVSKVLEELPVNKHNNIIPASTEEPDTAPGKLVHIGSVQRLLDSGIVRVRARTLDIHGFRKLQKLIQGQNDIWSDGTKFDQLLLPLLDILEESIEESKPAKALDLKTQILLTIQIMFKFHPGLFSTFHPRALCALLTARKHIPNTSHMVHNLFTMAKLISARCQPDDCVDAVLDLLETESGRIHECSTFFMGISVLEFLLHRYNPSSPPSPLALDEIEAKKKYQLTNEHELRMGKLAAQYLADNSSDVRRAVVHYIVQLHDCISDKPHFWKFMGSAVGEYRSLVTYYIAKRAEAPASYNIMDY